LRRAQAVLCSYSASAKSQEWKVQSDRTNAAEKQVTLSAIFYVFLRMGLVSFGGGLSGWAHREVVAKRGWVTDREFFSGLALAQIIPGTNISNLTVFLGNHLRGFAGAAIALTGLLLGPFVVVLVLFSAYDAISSTSWVENALDGVTAAAIGLILVVAGQGARMAGRRATTLIAFVATFLAVGVLRWPMVPVVVVVGALSVTAAVLRKRT
jgi:chromate transporter